MVEIVIFSWCLAVAIIAYSLIKKKTNNEKINYKV